MSWAWQTAWTLEQALGGDHAHPETWKSCGYSFASREKGRLAQTSCGSSCPSENGYERQSVSHSFRTKQRAKFLGRTHLWPSRHSSKAPSVQFSRERCKLCGFEILWKYLGYRGKDKLKSGVQLKKQKKILICHLQANFFFL